MISTEVNGKLRNDSCEADKVDRDILSRNKLMSWSVGCGVAE